METLEKLESTNSNILLQEEEYQTELILYSNDTIEFKIKSSNPTASCYYTEKYNLEQIKEKASLYFKEMKKVYDYYKRKFERKEINLLLSEDRNIMYINYKTTMYDEEIEIKLDLKKCVLKSNDIVDVLAKEVEGLKKANVELKKNNEDILKQFNEIKNNYDLLMEEYNKTKKKEKEEEQRKIDEEKKEEQRQKDEENFSAMNDNLNLNNNFEFKNFENLQFIEAIPVEEMRPKTVAVYSIIKNNKRLYQMAYPKYKFYYYGEHNKVENSDIIIYNLTSNKIDNRIYEAHNGIINNIKHYYDSFTKCHFLLSISYINYNSEFKIWKISPSNQIEEYLKQNTNENSYNTNYCFNACLLFKDEKFLIYGGRTNQKMNEYNDKGNQQKSIGNSQIDTERNFIEAAYIKIKDEDKKYILLSGKNSSEKLYLSERFDCDTGEIKTYYHNDNQSNISCMNLFKKGNEIFLINSTGGGMNIFNFETAETKKSILIGSNVCSISQKYIIISNKAELKIIDMEKESIVSKSSVVAHYDGKEKYILGIEKIKIPEKGEYIVTYSQDCIKIWKI